MTEPVQLQDEARHRLQDRLSAPLPPAESVGGTPKDRTTAGPPWIAAHWPLLLAGLGMTLWLLGLRDIAISELTGTGVLSVLSPVTFIAYPLVLAGAVGEVRRHDRRTWVLALITVVMLVMVYGLLPAVESAARLQVASLHAGLTEYIAQTGTVLDGFDTRFSWPAFFAAVAFICRAAGFDNPAPLLAWAPLLLAGLATLAFRALAYAVFKNRMAGWIAVWIFLVGNWTEQDYFSPQAVSIVLLIGALALVVQYLVRPGILSGGWRHDTARLTPISSTRDRIWSQLLFLVLALALAPTHQLTPFALVGMLLVLLVCGRLHATWLPALSFVPVFAWFVLGAGDFWGGQFGKLTESFGRIDSSLNKGIGQKLVGDPGHQAVVQLRIGLTAVIGLLALAGCVILWRRGARSLVLPILAVCSFGLAFLQPYGGEVLVRCFLYALSWLSIAGAIGLSSLLRRDHPSGDDEDSSSAPGLVVRALPAVAVGAVLSMLVVGTVIARGGNDAYVGVTDSDQAAMSLVYEQAKPGDTVASLLWYTPMLSSRIGDVKQTAVPQLSPNRLCDEPDQMAGCIDRAGVRFVVINDQQEAAGVILKGFPAGWTLEVQDDLVDTGKYTTVLSQDGVAVLTRTGLLGER